MASTVIRSYTCRMVRYLGLNNNWHVRISLKRGLHKQDGVKPIALSNLVQLWLGHIHPPDYFYSPTLKLSSTRAAKRRTHKSTEHLPSEEVSAPPSLNQPSVSVYFRIGQLVLADPELDLGQVPYC